MDHRGREKSESISSLNFDGKDVRTVVNTSRHIFGCTEWTDEWKRLYASLGEI